MQPDSGQAERLTEDDRAQAAADQWVERSLAAHRLAASKAGEQWAPGVCRNCGEQPIVGLWCDGDCREDFERRKGRA